MELTVARDFAIALLIGALVGIEREKRNAAEHAPSMGGLRTFIFLALTGAVAAWLSQQLGTPWLFVVAVAGVVVLVATAYVMTARQRPEDLGLTTELAAVAVTLLGGAVMAGAPGVAVALAIVASAALAYKQPLHAAVGELDTDDLYAGIKLLIASFIVLPLLPDRAVDPLGALNPYRLWWLVVLIAGLSLVGYLAGRWLGVGIGAAVTGLAGGLVSSTAVTLGFARRSREAEADGATAGSALVGADALACGILLAWAVMFARIVIEVAVVNPALVRAVVVPMAAMGAVSLAAGLVTYRLGARRSPGATAEVALRNPFSLTAASKFALLFAVVLLVVALVERSTGGRGLYVVAGVAGLTDVDAITLSMADYARQGGSPATAVTAIVIAALTNTAVKAGMVALLGSRALRLRTLAATGFILAAAVAALALT